MGRIPLSLRDDGFTQKRGSRLRGWQISPARVLSTNVRVPLDMNHAAEQTLCRQLRVNTNLVRTAPNLPGRKKRAWESSR